MHDIQHILVVDDDTRIRDLLAQYLVEHDFFVTSAKDAEDARVKLAEYDFDLLIMDIMMPGEQGTELTASLRRHNDVPILMLTAMGDVEDRIAGLECGANDYLPKPFEPRELLLRIKNLLGRSKNKEKSGKILRFGNFTFDVKTGSLKGKDENIPVTSNEISLLKILSSNPGKVVSREDMAKKCGGINERSVDVQITRLRNKIESDPKNPQHLKTIRGKGYVLYGSIE